MWFDGCFQVEQKQKHHDKTAVTRKLRKKNIQQKPKIEFNSIQSASTINIWLKYYVFFFILVSLLNTARNRSQNQFSFAKWLNNNHTVCYLMQIMHPLMYVCTMLWCMSIRLSIMWIQLPLLTWNEKNGKRICEIVCNRFCVGKNQS